MNPATIAPVGPIKFWAGLFGGLIELNHTHEGTSLGVYEISARNKTVPAPSRIRPMTSFHALCFRDCPITAPSVIPTSGLSMQNRANCGLQPNTRQTSAIDGAGRRRLFLMTQLA